MCSPVWAGIWTLETVVCWRYIGWRFFCSANSNAYSSVLSQQVHVASIFSLSNECFFSMRADVHWVSQFHSLSWLQEFCCLAAKCPSRVQMDRQTVFMSNITWGKIPWGIAEAQCQTWVGSPCSIRALQGCMSQPYSSKLCTECDGF